MVSFFAPRNAANECNRQRDSDRRRSEVVIRQPSHLGEIAHGGFAAIVLPVGVGGKRGSRIKGKIGAYGGKFLRIPRQDLLRCVGSDTEQA